MIRIVQFIDDLNDRVGLTASWLTVLMVLITFAVVVLRFGFNLGWIGMQESVTYLHATLFLAGAAFTLRHEGHVRVDIFYSKMSDRGQAVIDLLGTLFLLMPVCGFIAWMSWDYVLESWSLHEGSPEAGGLPGLYLLKSMILVMAVLLLLQGLAIALRCLLFLSGRITPLKEDQEMPGEEI
jgi:TRAP-type mannitol/chloroaromatic compound transport system permease small subunit